MTRFLKRSLESKEKIQIMYIDRNEKVSQRYVTVISVNESHVICYCHYKRQRRMFKLENILSAGPIRKSKLV